MQCSFLRWTTKTTLYPLEDEKRATVVVKLHLCLYGLEDTSKVCLDQIGNKLADVEIEVPESAPCIPQGSGIIAVGYVDDFLVYNMTKIKMIN